ncbi:Acetyl-CoA synthetase [hydrothermal vent metagenome]|uniref:Acetyl-CoA synthetase n=1 Tax=hydrothermal vent metagenome TaxID=652676 RepID=A0A3B0TUP0_9ZZZZ
MEKTTGHRHMPAPLPYDDLIRSFNWDIPARFNIGTDIADKWARTNRIALIVRDENGSRRDVTFKELTRQSNRLANVLKAHGLGPGDRIGLLLPQCPQTAISHIAAYKIGAIAVPLASLFGVDALLYRLADSGAKIVVTDAAGAEKIAEIADQLADLTLVIVVGGGGDSDFDRLLEGGADSFEAVASGPDDPAVMVYTSGTTGPPKGALHGHRVLLGHLPGVAFTHDGFPQKGDVMWTPADWAWAGGLFNILLPSLHFGLPVVVHNFQKFDPEAAFALMADCGVRNAFVPPTALKMMRTVAGPAKTHDLVLRTIASGGETLGGEVYDWGRAELGLTINEFYGQTECNIVVGSSAALGVSRRGAIGKPVPGHQVAIIDPWGREVDRGEPGQIAIRRPDPVMFLGYWRQPQATADKFIGDWMTTGDQGIMDNDGYIGFVGRNDDVITSAGYRIGPGEIEDCLIGHPAIALAAAVGKPDPLRTQIVKAFVVLAKGYEPSSALAEEIREHVRTRLSAHEYPREIDFIDELPLTTTGKIIRRLLRET